MLFYSKQQLADKQKIAGYRLYLDREDFIF